MIRKAMDIDARLKALVRLAQSKSDAARAALEKEFDQVSKTLETESEYDSLTRSLDILDVIGYRFSDRAVGIVDAFIRSIEARKLRYTRAEEFLSREIERYNNAQTLVARAIEVAVHLHYYETQSVLQILLRVSNHPSERIRKKVFEGFSAVASYDLDVFYGPDRRGGIGAAPQQQIIDTLEIQSDSEIRTHYQAILKLLGGLLSPAMEGASWSSTAVTLSRGATPALPLVSEIRRRSVRLLRRLYALATTKKERLDAISVLNGATRTDRHAALDDKASEMTVRDAIDVLTFYAELVPIEDLQIVQKIEHNSYWIFVHAHREEIRAAALIVEKALAAHSEYQIYRVLVGFEGVFSDWSTLQQADEQWNLKERERREKASEFARSITPKSYPEWRTRILAYAKTESEDLATFPVFYHFLDEFAVTHPELALRLVTAETAGLSRFLIPMLHGLWDGACRAATRVLIERWVREAVAGEVNNLFASTKLFLSTKDLDLALLGSLLERAVEIKDIPTARQITAVAIVQYPTAGAGGPKLKQLLFRALDVLAQERDASWIYEAWFRGEAQQLFAELESEETDHVLRNLRVLPKIEYHAEEVLALIAERTPEKVIEFFCERINREPGEEGGSRAAEFEAVPFEFYKLQEPLSKIPGAAVRIILAQFRGDESLFAFRGARLLHNIFPKFSAEFEAQLFELIRQGGETNYKFVVGILRSYHGEPFIHLLCKEIVKAIPGDSSLRTEVLIALETTGMVSGPFGFSEAYERKRQEVLDWLTDPDERVQEFAKWYIANLERMRDGEQKRAEEDIALRKFRFGEE
jgi:hypothetical protein